MNDNAVMLLDKIAEKLGVTASYLWAVMLKQAPVYATIQLVEYAVTILVIVLVFAYRKSLNKLVRGVFDSDVDILGVIGCIIFAIVSVAWIIACLASIGDTVTALVNPEYWALDQLLATIKKAK
jgi:hypothetical protein